MTQLMTVAGAAADLPIPDSVKIAAGAATVSFIVVASIVGLFVRVRSLAAPSPSPASTRIDEHEIGEDTLNRRIREDRYEKLADYIRDEFLLTRRDQTQLREQQNLHQLRLDAFEREWRKDRALRDAKLERIFTLIDARKERR